MTILPHEKQIYEYEDTLQKLRDQKEVWAEKEIASLEKKLQNLKKKVYGKLSSWDRIQICRHPKRPHASDYIRHVFQEFVPLHGDRQYADDRAMIMGCAYLGKQPFFVLGQEKGKDLDTRIMRNFGMPHPEGYRKALRGMKLAEKFGIPIVSFIDTPGAYPGLSAEERGQGWAIAQNLFEMAGLTVPVIVVLIGEGCSGGALGIGIGDCIGMLEHSYYSVISPEGCAAILWQDVAQSAKAAEKLKLHAEDLFEYKVIDQIISEPLGGAHHNPKKTYDNVKTFIVQSYKKLNNRDKDELIASRYQKFRCIGSFEESC
ncbi:MAG: acetyl-CoA carboxylase carboxyltransferase subunit alpha [Chlamydiota bacterium]